MTRIVFCEKLQKEAEGFDTPPYPGEVGKRIYEKISKAAWNLWLEHQTKLINEYRLSLVEPKARALLEKEMIKFLFEGGSTLPPGYKPEESNQKT